MRFLCDEMLGRCARYLRAAGYDTTLAMGGLPDRDLLEIAHRERRHLLTCDRRIAEHRRARDTAFILPRGNLDDAAAAITRAFHVDWLHAPFTRCLIDNSPLAAVMEPDRARVPDDVDAGNARHCPTCGRIYWAGSHHRRMQRRLEGWAAGAFGEQR